MQVAETFLPIIHLVFSNLKTWLRGTHHGVSPQHLSAYLNEFTFRFNRRFYPFNVSNRAIHLESSAIIVARGEPEQVASDGAAAVQSGCSCGWAAASAHP